MDNLQPKENLIDKIDNYLVNAHKEIADSWQKISSYPKGSLETALYTSSAVILGADCFFEHFPKNTVAAFIALNAASSSVYAELRMKTSSEYEHMDRMFGFPKKTFKSLGIAVYSLGSIFTALGASLLSYDFIFENQKGYQYSSTLFAFSLGIYLWKTADYISRVNISPPKKRRKLSEMIKDKISLLFPKPVKVPDSR